ncbi:MAG: adenylate/guanylate cyclase domain-containing protein, partial [bacterium]
MNDKQPQSELIQKIQEQQNLIRRLQRYLPERIVHRVLTTPDQLKIEGERRNVTVLFADITGFTELSETLDAEDVVQVINDYFTRMLEIIGKYEGTLDKFMGDAMMVLFGAPVAHENDPERAIRAALEMQSAMAAFNRSRIVRRLLPKPLQMSIAINSGRVFAGNVGSETRAEYTIMGENVNLAYRIESIANPGQTVIGENIYYKTRNLFRFQSLGEFKFKGIKNPTQVYLVIGEKESHKTLAINKGGEPSTTPILGRGKELSILEKQIQQVEQGKGNILYITGEAGVGKSRLIIELERLSLSHGLLFMKSECVSFNQSIAYHPFLSILKTFLSIWEEDTPELRSNKMVHELTKLELNPDTVFPILSPLFGIKSKSETKTTTLANQQQQIFKLLQDILIRAMKLYNVRVLIIEDLQWSDQTSLDLLTELCNKVASEPILICVSARSDFKLECIKQHRFVSIFLEKLSSEYSKQLISILFNSENISPELTKIIQQKSEGNPLFIEELTRNLAESHLTETMNDQVSLATGVSSLAIPDTIDQVVMARLDRLEEPVRLVAQYATVIGKQFSVPILQELVNLDIPILHRYLNQLQSAGIIYPTDHQYMFYHGMLAEVAYHSLLQHHRR